MSLRTFIFRCLIHYMLYRTAGWRGSMDAPMMCLEAWSGLLTIHVYSPSPLTKLSIAISAFRIPRGGKQKHNYPISGSWPKGTPTLSELHRLRVGTHCPTQLPSARSIGSIAVHNLSLVKSWLHFRAGKSKLPLYWTWSYLLISKISMLLVVQTQKRSISTGLGTSFNSHKSLNVVDQFQVTNASGVVHGHAVGSANHQLNCFGMGKKQMS